jgi:hypothetical protein
MAGRCDSTSSNQCSCLVSGIITQSTRPVEKSNVSMLKANCSGSVRRLADFFICEIFTYPGNPKRERGTYLTPRSLAHASGFPKINNPQILSVWSRDGLKRLASFVAQRNSAKQTCLISADPVLGSNARTQLSLLKVQSCQKHLLSAL